MRMMLAAVLTLAPGIGALAQSDLPRFGNAEFSGFKTFWVQKPEGCQPMISFNIKNISSGAIGPIRVLMDVVDKDRDSVFAGGVIAVPSDELPPGKAKEVVIGGDHEIAPHDCLGDMHEAAFSTIHFGIRLTAATGDAAASFEVARDEPMQHELVPNQK